MSDFSTHRFSDLFHIASERLAGREETRVVAASGATLSVSYFVLNAAATLIAGYGLLANSEAVIIGAMLIAMLYGPILAIGLALAELDASLLARALISEIAGVAWVLAIGILIGLVHWKIPLSDQLLARTKPNLLDLMIALVGGAAGAYASASPRISGAIVGVAIATALCPPLTACGILIARGYPTLAAGAALLFFTNLVAIATAAMATFLVLGHRARLAKNSSLLTLAARSVPLLLLVLLGFYLIDALHRSVEEVSLRNSVLAAIESGLKNTPGAHVVEVRLENEDGRRVAFVVVRAPATFTAEMVARLDDEIDRAVGRNLSLHLRTLLVEEMTREGPAFQTRRSEINMLR
ncbi:putative hydrophobic protein (TIGR00271 family) [Rhodoblastus acidophilus]|uniref:DUF389 domain-containing protein n=1 Tax=Rhodoblastus acidophilus TaxID=1074 RepID=UPI0022246AD3|nr:DUF389 domain-containing protein [Rhodoblastus acidophilus]MCW2286772.1 putative hydrophobic protein (TIGR00271 family) [Rhodoblastus acidophilus]MCW2335610.1 putative hydrophobic protein (TIGR00271 family) [Rhodoblastus acidophilus]